MLTLRLVAVLSMLILQEPLTAIAGAQEACQKNTYREYDSRLKAVRVGTVPLAGQPVVGFEMVPGGFIVATTHHIFRSRSNSIHNTISLDRIIGISVNAQGDIIVQRPNGLVTISEDGIFSPIKSTTLSPRGRLINSGNDLYVDAVARGVGFDLSLRKADGHTLPFLEIDEPLRTLSWNSGGLSAVVGHSLIVWPDGDRKATLLANDAGLVYATSSCFVDSSRALVSIGDFTALVTPTSQLVIAGVRTHCSNSKANLFLLDDHGGVVWQIAGLSALGDRKLDADYAAELIRRLDTHSAEADPRFLEAARIIGCIQANALRAKGSTTKR